MGILIDLIRAIGIKNFFTKYIEITDEDIILV